MRYYEDFIPGKKARFSGSYEVTDEEIIEMGTRWDPQPFHTDPEAAKESIFGGLVASSVHLFAIAVRLGQQDREPIAALTALGFQDLRWHAPARPGDILTMSSEILKTRLSKSRPGVGIVESRNEIYNQNDELVFAYSGAALIRCRPAENESR